MLLVAPPADSRHMTPFLSCQGPPALGHVHLKPRGVLEVATREEAAEAMPRGTCEASRSEPREEPSQMHQGQEELLRSLGAGSLQLHAAHAAQGLPVSI